MTIQELKDKNLLIFDCIVGSHLYNLNTPTSDVDCKGVYILPHDVLLGNRYIEQVSDEKNDNNYYELARFIELLKTGNPNMLDLLAIPEDKIVYKHPIYDMILEHKDKFITKKCKGSFGGYALTQISKSHGLNKKMMNPISIEKKSPLDFCYAYSSYDATPLKKWLDDRMLKQKYCGVSNLPHSKDMMVLFYDFKAHSRFENDDCVYLENGEIKHRKFNPGEFNAFKKQCLDGNGNFLHYKGIIKEDENGEFHSNTLRMSSIPKSEQDTFLTLFSYNKDGYTTYLKKYREYWGWVEKRNPARYQNNIEHGKNYDSKNLCHCIRLLNMAIEIASEQGIIANRTIDREYLLDIRSGKMEYEEIIKIAEEKIKLSDELFDKSNLPDDVDEEFVYNLLIDIRKKFYNL